MPRATVTFHRLIQDTQDVGTPNQSGDHMVSRIEFSVTVGGRTFDGLWVEAKQPYGSNYALDPLEVARPQGAYRGTWNHAAFGDAVEAYYREAFGAAGATVSFGGARVRMRNNTVVRSKVVQIDLPDGAGGTW